MGIVILGVSLFKLSRCMFWNLQLQLRARDRCSCARLTWTYAHVKCEQATEAACGGGDGKERCGGRRRRWLRMRVPGYRCESGVRMRMRVWPRRTSMHILVVVMRMLLMLPDVCRRVHRI